ncbi:hypothetical protein SISNIDRAFT_417158 [Sistotremastrum niveocremeum HHB9708]|uniref:Uncharacterized protein n=1 Tax=Sistotremastrum niveocremeum HHB9708 TaxID=1314777 RepID=A0A164Q2Z8_9AGAM|nr:hypothetical protein SISNIDRAFT_417158 [Sistotremastrum niveocremeum HHB9708]
MPAPNPLLAGQWTAKKFRSTVINDIWPEVLFFTLIATMVALVSEKTSTSLAVSNQMLTVLGIVLGLVVSFRTSSAYDRYVLKQLWIARHWPIGLTGYFSPSSPGRAMTSYWEGRKLWTSIILASRNLAQLVSGTQ